MAEFRAGKSEAVRELCRRLRPVLGSKVESLFQAYALEDADGKAQLEAYLEALASKHLSPRLEDTAADLVPPSPQQTAGPYVLGTVQYAGQPKGVFGLRESEWIQHVGVFGRSGAGKTNLGFELFRQLVANGKPVLVFDWKRNYRDLLSLPDFHDVEVRTVGRDVAPFHFNPLIPPPGTDARTWLKQLIEVVAHSYCLGNGVLYLLQETLNAVYNESGVYTNRVESWPTFRQVLQKTKERNAHGREAAWLSSTLRALNSLCFGAMDEMLNTTEAQGRNIERLLTKSVILEMDALGQADKVFLVSALLLYIHHLRMAEGQREHFKHAIIVEEAHHILSNERRSLIGGQSVMEITFREIREFGESIVILDQHPSKISLSALGNTYCTICLNLKHQKDVFAMAQSMLLESDERDILGNLEVGQAVVKLQGRATRPFLIEIPEFELKKGAITDAALELKMMPVYGGGPSGSKAADDDEQVSVDSPPTATVTRTTDARPREEPSEGAVRAKADPVEHFLADVRDHPDSGIAARYKRLGISVRQGQKLKQRAVEQGLTEEEDIRTPTGRLRVIRLTEKGRQALENVRRAA